MKKDKYTAKLERLVKKIIKPTTYDVTVYQIENPYRRKPKPLQPKTIDIKEKWRLAWLQSSTLKEFAQKIGYYTEKLNNGNLIQSIGQKASSLDAHFGSIYGRPLKFRILTSRKRAIHALDRTNSMVSMSQQISKPGKY
jgi:hypothetical protein